MSDFSPVVKRCHDVFSKIILDVIKKIEAIPCLMVIFLDCVNVRNRFLLPNEKPCTLCLNFSGHRAIE
jgi:hypothetical protein